MPGQVGMVCSSPVLLSPFNGSIPVKEMFRKSDIIVDLVLLGSNELYNELVCVRQ